jgi:hypothetical protein
MSANDASPQKDSEVDPKRIPSISALASRVHWRRKLGRIRAAMHLREADPVALVRWKVEVMQQLQSNCDRAETQPPGPCNELSEPE